MAQIDPERSPSTYYTPSASPAFGHMNESMSMESTVAETSSIISQPTTGASSKQSLELEELQSYNQNDEDKNYFDGIVSCGAGFSHYEVSHHLLHHSKLRNHFASKVMLVLALQVLISAIITTVLQYLSPSLVDPNKPEIWTWLPLIPCILYAVIFIVFRVLQLSRKRIVNWILAGSLSFLMIAASSLMFTVLYWHYYLGSIFITFLIMCILLYKYVDLFHPTYKFYAFTIGTSLIISLLTILMLHVEIYVHRSSWFLYTEAILGILLVNLSVSLIAVYELKKMIRGRRMNLNENEYIMAAILL